MAIITRLAWIKRQQERFRVQERQTEREYVSGESHYFQGARYRLNVILQDGPGRVLVRNKQFIDLYVRPDSTVEARRRIMTEWYRAHLKMAILDLIEKWEKGLGVHIEDWGVRKMKTRWGVCNIEARRIWLNLELAKKSPRCVEFIVVHELVHLLERRHNDRFRSLMDHYLPQWQFLRAELNREPLAHEDWKY